MMPWANELFIKPQQNNEQGLYLDRPWAFRSAVTESWIAALESHVPVVWTRILPAVSGVMTRSYSGIQKAPTIVSAGKGCPVKILFIQSWQTMGPTRHAGIR